MLKRTSKIFASDSYQTVEVTVKVKIKRFNTSDATREASDTVKTIEDEITTAVFTPRFYSRNIQFSAQPD
jgi:hypothetical protein